MCIKILLQRVYRINVDTGEEIILPWVSDVKC